MTNEIFENLKKQRMQNLMDNLEKITLSNWKLKNKPMWKLENIDKKDKKNEI